VFYMPRAPYLPPGTLREVLTYPSQKDQFARGDFAPALTRLGLERLVPLLDESRRWDRELNDEEQQSLTFSRILLHKPRFIVIDEVFDAMDEDGLGRIMDVLSKELKDAAVVHIGRALPGDGIFKRVVHLIKDPQRRLPPAGLRAVAQ
jgi:vitamin B12/bleomycin/antimicrobial peptide transport system ATP-binding/permease protein